MWEDTVFSDETTIQMFRKYYLGLLIRRGQRGRKLTSGIVKHPLFKGAFCAQRIVGFHVYLKI